jgi:6,7-dimethyl-8-ribityllumazine synthase
MAGDADSDRRVEPVLDGTGVRVAVVAGRFNDLITFRLLDGVERGLADLGAPAPIVEWVPGAFEIPLAAKAFAESGRVDAVIGLGCVVRGATTHYEAVAGESAAGILRAGLATGVPVIFGVLTTEDLPQALERSEDAGGHNVGEEGAHTAVEMVRLLERIRKG